MNWDDIGWTELAAGAAVVVAVVSMLYTTEAIHELNGKIEDETAENAETIEANRQAIIDQWPRPELVLTDHRIAVETNTVCFRFKLRNGSINEWWPSTIWYPYNDTYQKQHVRQMRILDGEPEVCYRVDSWRQLNRIDWAKPHYITTTHQDPVFLHNLTITREDRRELLQEPLEIEHPVWNLTKDGDTQ